MKSNRNKTLIAWLTESQSEAPISEQINEDVGDMADVFNLVEEINGDMGLLNEASEKITWNLIKHNVGQPQEEKYDGDDDDSLSGFVVRWVVPKLL